MSDERESNVKFDPIAQPFVDFWSIYIQQANDCDARAVGRDQWQRRRENLAAAVVRHGEQKHGRLHA